MLVRREAERKEGRKGGRKEEGRKDFLHFKGVLAPIGAWSIKKLNQCLIKSVNKS